MGLESVLKVLGFLTGVGSGISSMAESIALAGLIIVFAIAIAYAIWGLAKLGKLVLRMKVHQFALFILGIGFALIAIAALLP